jgi:hypothetical protein
MDAALVQMKLQASVRIQGLVRGRAQRKAFQKQVKAVVTIASIRRMQLGIRERLKREAVRNAAATKFQAVGRSYLSRMRMGTW